MIDDPFGKIPVEIERVIDASSTKTFDLKSDVFYLDDEHGLTRIVSFKNTKILAVNPLPVRNDAQSVIGAASIEVQSGVVTASIFLDYFTPERLNIEIDGQKLWPHLVGYTQTVRLDNRTVATAFNVKSIDLMPNPTNDPRIVWLKV